MLESVAARLAALELKPNGMPADAAASDPARYSLALAR
jgi:hypothetical protein